MKRKSSKDRTSKTIASKRKKGIKSTDNTNGTNLDKTKSPTALIKTKQNKNEMNHSLNQLTLKHQPNSLESPTSKIIPKKSGILKKQGNKITNSKTRSTAKTKASILKNISSNRSQVKEASVFKSNIAQENDKVAKNKRIRAAPRKTQMKKKLTKPIPSMLSQVGANCSETGEQDDEEEDDEENDDVDDDVDDDDDEDLEEEDCDSDSSCDCDDCRREAGKKPMVEACDCPFCQQQQIRAVDRSKTPQTKQTHSDTAGDSESGDEDDDSDSEDEQTGSEHKNSGRPRTKRDDNQNENSNTKEDDKTEADESSDEEEGSEDGSEEGSNNASRCSQRTHAISASTSTTSVMTSASHVTSASAHTAASTHVSSDIQHSHCEVPNCRSKVFSACPKCEILVCYKHLNEDITCCKDHGKGNKKQKKSWLLSWW